MHGVHSFIILSQYLVRVLCAAYCMRLNPSCSNYNTLLPRNCAIADYLKSSGYIEAFNHFVQESDVVSSRSLLSLEHTKEFPAYPSCYNFS